MKIILRKKSFYYKEKSQNLKSKWYVKKYKVLKLITSS